MKRIEPKRVISLSLAVCLMTGLVPVLGQVPDEYCFPGEPFGDGSDGDCSFLVDAGLDRNWNCIDVLVDTNVTLNTKGFTLYACGTLINKGTITDNHSGSGGGRAGLPGLGADPMCGPTAPGCPPNCDTCTTGGNGVAGDPPSKLEAGAGGRGGGAGGGGGGAWAPLPQRDADGGDGGGYDADYPDDGRGGKGGGYVKVYALHLNNQGTIEADGDHGEDGRDGPNAYELDPDRPEMCPGCGAECYPWPELLPATDIAGGGGGGGGGGAGGDGGTVEVYYAALLSSDPSVWPQYVHASGGDGGTGGDGGAGGDPCESHDCCDLGAPLGDHNCGCNGGAPNGGRGGCACHYSGTQPQDGINGGNGAGGAPGTRDVRQLQACCLPDDTCEMLDATSCTVAGGTSVPDEVCLPLAACCDPVTGECEMVAPVCCDDAGGTPQGPGTVCTAPEACCFPNDTCQMLDPLCCVDQGGVPQGPGSVCLGMEACCDAAGACYMADALCCLANGDTPQGPGTVCTAPEACCLFPECFMLDPLCCDHIGGIPLGPGSQCTQPEACCTESSDCLMDDPLCCGLIMGMPQGPGTVCLGMEACCLPNGTCVMVDALCCVNELGGDPQGPGSQCWGMEACCWPDGGCEEMDGLCCINGGGLPQGLGSQCWGMMACVFPFGTCQDMDGICCMNQGGTPLPGEFCLGIEACCFPDDTCQNIDALVCLPWGGVPQGPGSVCQGMEACCTPATASCFNADALCCVNQGGAPQGPGTSCTVVEACCMGDGTCAMLDPLCCVETGGTPMGSGTACTDLEGCCLEGGTCLDLDPLCCEDMGGVPQGPDTACSIISVACCWLAGMECEETDPLCCDELFGIVSPIGSEVCLGDGNGDLIDDACVGMGDGACCFGFTGGGCVETTEEDCSHNFFGLYQGDGTTCGGYEACCMSNGTCDDIGIDATCCINEFNGTPQGPGTTCSTPETCCYPSGSCQEIDPLCCDDLGGSESPIGEPVCLGDGNENGVDDACEPPTVAPDPEPGGPPCVTADDCTGLYQGADCVDGICYVAKNRYLSIDPTTNVDPVAYQVEIVEASVMECAGTAVRCVNDLDCEPGQTCDPLYRPGALGRTWWMGDPVCYDYPDGNPVPGAITCEGPNYFGWVSMLRPRCLGGTSDRRPCEFLPVCMGGTSPGVPCATDLNCPSYYECQAGNGDWTGVACTPPGPECQEGEYCNLKSAGFCLSCPGGLCVADLPAPRIWTEVPVHVTGCPVAPVITYAIRASADGVSFSDPLVINTIHVPVVPQNWGDLSGGPEPGQPPWTGRWLPPDRTMSMADVQAAIRTFENKTAETGFPSRVWVETEINQVINLADVQFLVMAFEGRDYAIIGLPQIGLDPVLCPPSVGRLGGYGNSGCLPGTRSDGRNGRSDWCDDDVVQFTVGPGTLEMLHHNAEYNCCPDDIVVSMSMEGNLIRLREHEILTDPCYCMCCYDVEATVINLAPGPYTVQLCWLEPGDPPEETCYQGEVVIP